MCFFHRYREKIYRQKFEKYKHHVTDKSKDECCLCLDTYDNSVCVKLDGCEHILHSQCAWSYFIDYDNEQCPLCESDQATFKNIIKNCG